MAKNIGILLDQNFGLVINNRSMVVGDVTYQNQMILLTANKGEIKEDPLAGVGVSNYLESSDSAGLAREIRSQFTRDGQKVSNISVVIPTVNVEASYV
jgi:hypothetical protein